MDWDAVAKWWGGINWDAVWFVGGAMSLVFWVFLVPMIDKEVKAMAEEKRQKQEHHLRQQELDLRKQELELERVKLDARPEIVPLTPTEKPDGRV